MHSSARTRRERVWCLLWLSVLDAVWPGAFDIRDNGPDIRIGQTAKRRHIAGIPRRSGRLAAMFDGSKEPLVAPLPGTAALIKWRSRHGTIRTSLRPTLLPFQIAAMT